MTSWLKDNHPDIVDGDSMTLRIPLPKDAILSFFGHNCSAADTCDRNSVDSREAESTPLVASSIWGYRSALINEGKRQLKSNGFELLALKMMTLEPKTKGQA
ncbi:hypothetical protein PHMEG_00018492 [Phytophthora megakarya]|uniref:Uncharacterized protein n=1 Tax=Phytophthora megakarya TaxID=4795 RepID=A0A225VU94_9STRA|nr:hypothetical protein PHMEG_00018492 [Phytophthora megakarya]